MPASPSVPMLESLEVRVLLSLPGFADIAIRNLHVPATANVGDRVTVEYDLFNTGDQDVLSGGMDSIGLSKSPVAGLWDVPLTMPTHGDDIPAHGSLHMSEAVDLPLGATGRRYIAIFANISGLLEEGGQIYNNRASAAINILPLPPADLVPLSLAAGNMVTGQAVAVSAVVKNQGTNPAVGGWMDGSFAPHAGWVDSFYLSQDARWDSRDILLATQEHTAPLAPGETYNIDILSVVPPAALGAKYLLLKVDSGGAVNEKPTTKGNNVRATAAPVAGLRFNVAYGGMFVARSRAASVKVDTFAAAPGARLHLRLSDYQPLDFNAGLAAPDMDLVRNMPLAAAMKTHSLICNLSGLPYGTYTLTAELDRGGAIVSSQSIDITLVDEVSSRKDITGEAIGGAEYEAYNLEAGRAGDALLFRLGTNYPGADNDFRLKVAGATKGPNLFGIAGGTRTTEDGLDLTMGNLYRGVTFAPGEVVKTYPALIEDWGEEISGESFLYRLDHTGPGAWDYDLFGGVLLDSLGADVLRGLTLCWTMYCSNDTVELPIYKTTPQKAWVKKNLKDPELKILVSERVADDNQLSRTDMIDIIRRAARDDGKVDATELADLRFLVRNADYLGGMSDYVAILSGKIVNGDPSNRKYQGNNLGNMVAGSGETQVENLIQKWFYGADHPDVPVTYTYREVQGAVPTDASDFHYTDVRQGHLGDCYLLGTAAELASWSPETLANMFHDNGDGTWTIGMHSTRGIDYVTVDQYLPTDAGGNLVYANHGDAYDDPSNVLWPALLEKAYVQLTESGRVGSTGRQIVRSLFDSNAYETIVGGALDVTLKELTGFNSTARSFLFNKETTLVNSWNANDLITVATVKTPSNTDLVGNHAYALVDYDSTSGLFTLYNPWGMNNGSNKPGEVQLTWDQLKKDGVNWGQTVEAALPLLAVA